MRPVLLAILISAAPALAQAQAAYFQVINVAPNDTLNVRAEPSGGSADIGDLAHNAIGIEVAGTDATGKWGRIVWQEGNGWVSMRFLAPDNVPRVAGSILPDGLFCGGTEPFWGAEILSTGVKLNSGQYLEFADVKVAAGRADVPVNLSLEQGGYRSEMLIRPANCSDGMSDRIYPWGVDFISSTSAGANYQLGCCHLPTP